MAISPMEALYLGGSVADFKARLAPLRKRLWTCNAVALLGALGGLAGVIEDSLGVTIVPCATAFLAGHIFGNYYRGKVEKIHDEMNRFATHINDR